MKQPGFLANRSVSFQASVALLVYELVFITGMIYFVLDGSSFTIVNTIVLSIGWLMALWSIYRHFITSRKPLLVAVSGLLILLCYTFALLLQVGGNYTVPDNWPILAIAAPPVLALISLLFDKRNC